MAAGQPVSTADTAVVNAIKAETARIYEAGSSPAFYLTGRQLQPYKSSGLSLIVYRNDDTVTRVISTCFTRQGQLSTEYYFSNQKIIFIYQAFEYFDTHSAKGRWTNFKGLRGWECRLYYSGEQLVHHEQNGLSYKDITAKAGKNKAGAYKIIQYLAAGRT